MTRLSEAIFIKVVYVGHGAEILGKTHAIMSYGQEFVNLTDFVYECAYQKCVVYAVFDCCREIVKEIIVGIPPLDLLLKPYEGRLHILQSRRAGRMLEIEIKAEKH